MGLSIYLMLEPKRLAAGRLLVFRKSASNVNYSAIASQAGMCSPFTVHQTVQCSQQSCVLCFVRRLCTGKKKPIAEVENARMCGCLVLNCAVPSVLCSYITRSRGLCMHSSRHWRERHGWCDADRNCTQ